MSTPASNFAFPVPSEILEPYIRDAVATSVASALGDQASIIDALIKNAMNTKVSASGSKSRYDYENKYTLIEVVAKNELEGVIKTVIREMAQQMKPEIQAEIRRIMSAEDTVTGLAKAMVEGLLPSLQASWSVKLNVVDD